MRLTRTETHLKVVSIKQGLVCLFVSVCVWVCLCLCVYRICAVWGNLKVRHFERVMLCRSKPIRHRDRSISRSWTDLLEGLQWNISQQHRDSVCIKPSTGKSLSRCPGALEKKNTFSQPVCAGERAFRSWYIKAWVEESVKGWFWNFKRPVKNCFVLFLTDDWFFVCKK